MEESDSRGQPPADVSHLVRERTEARAARDFARADALKAEIEAAGWKVVDSGNRTSVTRAAPPDVEVSGERRYGSWQTVPSRLTEPRRPGVTVVAVASEEPDRLAALARALAARAPQGSQLVIVANDPSYAQEAILPDLASPGGAIEAEVLRTSARLGYAAALNLGLQRVATEHVVIADGTAVPTGDALSPLSEALADDRAAVAGAFGLAAVETVFRPSGIVRTDDRDPIALELAWLAFRSSDYVALGPLDEAFITPAWLDVWWSFRLRSGADPEAEPRGAVRLALPIGRDAPRPWPPERTRLARRNGYRVIDAFAADRRLLRGGQFGDSPRG